MPRNIYRNPVLDCKLDKCVKEHADEIYQIILPQLELMLMKICQEYVNHLTNQVSITDIFSAIPLLP